MILHDLFDEALSLIGVLAEGQEATKEQCLLCIRKINLLLAQWELDGIDLEFIPVDMDSLPQEVAIPSGSEHAVIYYLAFALAPNYRKTVTQEMYAAGQSFYSSLVRRTVTDQMAEVRVLRPQGEAQSTVTTDITIV